MFEKRMMLAPAELAGPIGAFVRSVLSNGTRASDAAKVFTELAPPLAALVSAIAHGSDKQRQLAFVRMQWETERLIARKRLERNQRK